MTLMVGTLTVNRGTDEAVVPGLTVKLTDDPPSPTSGLGIWPPIEPPPDALPATSVKHTNQQAAIIYNGISKK